MNPNDQHNEIVTDLKLAPRNGKGMVEYNMTFSMQKPIDMGKSNGVLFYSVVNRGNGTAAANASRFPAGSSCCTSSVMKVPFGTATGRTRRAVV